MSGYLNCATCRSSVKVGELEWFGGSALCRICSRSVLAEKAQQRAYEPDHQARAQQQANMQAMAENRIIQYAVGKIEERAIAKRETLVVHDNPNMTVTVVKRDPRIAELEAINKNLQAEVDHSREMFDMAHETAKLGNDLKEKAYKERDEAMQRANMLADKCGALRDENTQLLAENARLRRNAPR